MYYFDWIDAALGLVRVFRGWRPISIYGSGGGHWQRVLKRHGIKSKPAAIVSEGVVLQVKKENLARAREILAKNGADLA